MTMTSLEAMSTSAMRPSGDTLELVMPGTLSVVGGLRVLGVEVPDDCFRGSLQTVSGYQVKHFKRLDIHAWAAWSC